MAAKGYCSAEQVAGYMGIVLTGPQEELAGLAIESAENWIDRETEHAWLEATPITEVIYNPQTVYLRLAKPPIVSVTSVVVATPGCTENIPLTVDMNYFVHDLRDGIIYAPYTRHVYQVTVVYVPNVDPVPAEIQLATAALAASNMRIAPAFSDGVDPSIVQRYNVGGELEVEFRKALIGGTGIVPQQVLSYLDVWRRNYSVV